ncbi:phospholipase-like protein [Tanacetum coccineum]
MGSRIKANVSSSLKVYDAKVSARTRLYLLKTIGSKLAFKPERYKKFRSAVFGPWLDIRTQEHDNHLINYLLQHQRNVKDPSTNIPFIFDIGPNTIEFGRREFCLVTGFLFEDCSLDHLKGVNSCFRERVFPEKSSVKGLDLNKLLNNHTEFNKLLDDDAVRHWDMIITRYALLETSSILEFKNMVRNRLRTLTPSSDEMIQKWWRMSLEYLHELRALKGKSTYLMAIEKKSHVCSSCVEEGLSVPELLKKISDMQRDFQSRITTVEQFVNHHKTSKIGSDSHVLMLFSNSYEFVHHVRLSMWLQSTSCATDINANNVHKDSMDFDHDPKVVEQNEFDQNVGSPRICSRPATRCRPPPAHKLLNGKFCLMTRAEMIAVDALMKIINFDIPKESHTCDSVEEANDAKVQREAKASSFMCSKFWERLLGICKERRGWLSDTHLDIWVLSLWHYRPTVADWAICGPFFNTFMLGDKMQCCFVDGVTYGVYFPINVEDNHWILAEFHIRSGVITFYDSLPPENLIVEDRKWWLDARQLYSNKLPKLLIQSEVMEKKNIDPSNYSISYRLLNNLPLEVSNPTQAGLAYREHLTCFFWKYKIAK